MELPTFELGEVLEEDDDEGSYVFRSFLRGALRLPSNIGNWMVLDVWLDLTYHELAVFRVGEADTDRLVDKEDIRMLIPPIRVEC